MTYTVKKIETDSTEHSRAFQKMDIQKHYPRLWTIGNLDILNKNLLGFFCSIKCPGDIILKTYDLARSFQEKT